MADVPSRLSSGNIYYNGSYIPIQEYRNMILSRSLYSLDNEYKNTQLFSKNGQSNLASSISTVLNVVPQYNRMQVNTNLLGNIYDSFRDDGSPLAKIGLVMLGKQMAYNSAMNLSVKYVPSINVSRALKGGKLFNKNEDNTITIKNKADRTFGDKVSGFASNFLGVDTYDVFGNANPFSDPNNENNIGYIKNTGLGQLSRFYYAINMNIYKPVNFDANPDFSKTFIDYSKEAGITIDSTRLSILANQRNFTFDNKQFHQYIGIKILPDAISKANIAMDLAYSGRTDRVQEYAPTRRYVLDNFGSTVKSEDKSIFDWVDDKSNITTDTNKDKIVWGRDGLIQESKNYIGQFRGSDDLIDNDEPNDFPTKFNIKEGLLEYTKNLLNSTNGQFIDQTRKAFKKDNSIVGFNGSPLWETNDKKYSVDSGNELGKTGIRQHTVIDPYDRFAKSIRFKGNVVYNGESNGNQDSVVYKSVLPRIHPTRDEEGGINNKNLMFSIENLAVGTIKRDKYGVIDDEYGTPIPLSEVGPFAGRQMWFPPYNIEINEVAAAKFESTVMVGRNEPMYNYQNSERSATLTFSLIVDYPEQLRSVEYLGQNKNKEIADFFAFGGNPLPTNAQIDVIEEKIEKLRKQREELTGPVDKSEPPALTSSASPITVYFPNNMPFNDSNSINTVFNTMYNDMHYEILDTIESAQDGNGFGLNKKVYYLDNLIGTTVNGRTIYTGVSGNTDQYFVSGVSTPYGQCELNKNLLDVFGDEETRKYYEITITGTASKLYLTDNEKAYNEALGNRRAEATKELIIGRLTAMFGTTVANQIAETNIKTVLGIGSSEASSEGADPANMHNKNVKEERSATIRFTRNNVPVDDKTLNLNQQQAEDIENIDREIQALEVEKAKLKLNLQENVYNERNKAILNSFESVSGNQFYPAFHSQTPEDLHRRLTFLQQCTRQGAAKRYDIVDTNTGQLRARNSVFGKQPICILRLGDFFYTKVIIETVTIDYAEAPWDMNPEGFGMQPMMANVTLIMKVIGGQSLKGPVDALQNAVTFNYYANSNFTNKGIYGRASEEARKQYEYMKGVDGSSGLVGEKQAKMTNAYENSDIYNDRVREGIE